MAERLPSPPSPARPIVDDRPTSPAGAPGSPDWREVIVIGAGPAGLTAAYQLSKHGVPCRVLEADDVVGGISRTVVRDGWRFDVGGHRFFSKVAPVRRLWQEILGPEDFLLRPRMSRIHYRGNTFDYPLRAFNALRGLGLVEATRCFASYGWARLRPPRDQSTFEGWTTARFGRRLYTIFFKTYTEKVWGIPASEIQADWAAQRIKNLSLAKAVLNALLPKHNQKTVTSLIEEFHYPRHGPGMMWESARSHIESRGVPVMMERRVVAVQHCNGHAVGVISEHRGERITHPAAHVVSSMPLSELLMAMDPPVPATVAAAARGLRYRDFMTVALVVPAEDGFPDNWIYIHDTDVLAGRIQNFGSWSPHMVKEGRTCLGLEYFVNEGDALWSMDDPALVELATTELSRLRLVARERVQDGYVVRMRKAYPVYDSEYQVNVATMRRWLDEHAANVHPVGRNGMHRYNNQDHSMLTAMLVVENIMGARHDVWAVNVEADYHEEAGQRQPAVTAGSAPGAV